MPIPITVNVNVNDTLRAYIDPQTPEGVIARLKQTIAELTSENIALKARLASTGV